MTKKRISKKQSAQKRQTTKLVINSLENMHLKFKTLAKIPFHDDKPSCFDIICWNHVKSETKRKIIIGTELGTIYISNDYNNLTPNDRPGKECSP